MALVVVSALTCMGQQPTGDASGEAKLQADDGLHSYEKDHSQSDGDQGKRKRRGPPPEAIEACEGKSEGDQCSFEGGRGETVEGTCINPPRNNDLVCAPEGGPPGGGGDQGGPGGGNGDGGNGDGGKGDGGNGDGGQGGEDSGRRGPPPEALEACSASAEGDQCSFETPRGDTVSGTCRQVKDGQMACVPADHRGGGGNGPQKGRQ